MNQLQFEKWKLIDNRICELVKTHGSLRAVGRVLGIDVAYLKRLCDWDKKNPSRRILRKLKLLNIKRKKG